MAFKYSALIDAEIPKSSSDEWNLKSVIFFVLSILFHTHIVSFYNLTAHFSLFTTTSYILGEKGGMSYAKSLYFFKLEYFKLLLLYRDRLKEEFSIERLKGSLQYLEMYL